jgi:hypothetical protein
MPDAIRGVVSPIVTRPGERIGIEIHTARHRSERDCGIAERAGHVDVIAGLRAAAQECRASRNFAEHRDAEVQRPARRVAPTLLDIVPVGKRVEAARKRRKPRCVDPPATRRPAAPSAVSRPSPRGPTDSRLASCAKLLGVDVGRKCRPATSMSTDTASSHPGEGASSAASSPTPRCTDADRGGREKNRAITSNSFTPGL